MNKYYILTVFLLFSSFSSAQTDCGPYKVSMIQTQTNDFLVLLRSQNGKESWKFIGLWSAPSTKPYLGILMQAYAMKKNINLRYWKDNYNCDETDYSDPPAMVRMY